MSYKIEFPMPNHVHFSERSLSGFIDLVTKYRDHIECLYFPVGFVDENINLWGIRAPNFVYRDGALDKSAVLAWETALNMILGATQLPIKLLANNIYSKSFHNDDWDKVCKKLDYYRSKAHVQSITVTDVSVVDKVIAAGYQVSLSTNSHTSLQELDTYLELQGYFGLESVVLQRDLNRNPKKLQHYLDKRPQLKSKLVLMVNEGCVNACPYKNSGDVEISVDDVVTHDNKIHVYGCSRIADKSPWMFLTSQFLTKDALDTYYPFVDRIKLAGRNLPISPLKKQLAHYVDGVDHTLNNVMNVSDPNTEFFTNQLPEAYWRDVLSCNKECLTCGKCKEHYERLLVVTQQV